MKRSLAVVGLAMLAACGRPAVVTSALHGELGGLQRDIAAARANSELRSATVEQLAVAVAGREVRSAQGELAVRRLAQVRPCLDEVMPVVRDRATRRDDAGAAATMLLFERDGAMAARLVARYQGAESGAWRAVAARAMVAPEWGLARRAAFVDPDERVRRAAIAAAVARPDPDDRSALLEAARADPDPESRRLAIVAVGSTGDEATVIALGDRWPRASEAERLALVEAWSLPAAYAAGGRERLVHVVETSHGAPAITAASVLATQSDATRALGVGALERDIATGPAAERRLAMGLFPLGEPQFRGVLEGASKDADRNVSVLALAHLLARDPDEGRTLRALRAFASGDPADPVTLQARAALAAAGDGTVAEALAGELRAPRAYRRRLAALGLIALGDSVGAATALGDDDPYVRISVACAMLSDRKPRHR